MQVFSAKKEPKRINGHAESLIHIYGLCDSDANRRCSDFQNVVAESTAPPHKDNASIGCISSAIGRRGTRCSDTPALIAIYSA
jgi:hypothetical protein